MMDRLRIGRYPDPPTRWEYVVGCWLVVLLVAWILS